MKKQYNFVHIVREIEKKLKDPNLSAKERYFLEREIEYHRGVNFKFDYNDKIRTDFNSNILGTKNYVYLTHLLESFTFTDYQIEFYKRKNKKHDLFKLSNEVFENIDVNHKNIINNLSNHPYELYTIKKSNVNDHCFYSEYLKLPFVTVKDDSTVLTSIKLIHEMQHQVNYVINPICSTTQFKEVPSLFSEFYATEYLFEKTKDREFLKAYLDRLKNISELASILKAYLEMLTYYGANKEIEINNALREYKFKKKYLKEINIAEMASYILSFLMALSIKETFKNDKEQGLEYLYSIIDGSIMHNNIYFNDEYEKGIEVCKADYQKVMKVFK